MNENQEIILVFKYLQEYNIYFISDYNIPRF